MIHKFRSLQEIVISDMMMPQVFQEPIAHHVNLHLRRLRIIGCGSPPEYFAEYPDSPLPNRSSLVEIDLIGGNFYQEPARPSIGPWFYQLLNISKRTLERLALGSSLASRQYGDWDCAGHAFPCLTRLTLVSSWPVLLENEPYTDIRPVFANIDTLYRYTIPSPSFCTSWHSTQLRLRRIAVLEEQFVRAERRSESSPVEHISDQRLDPPLRVWTSHGLQHPC